MRPYYQNGGITIYHADFRCLLSDLPPVGLIITDPPYGIGATRMTLGNRKGTRVYRGAGDWDSVAGDIAPLLALDVPTVIWGGNYFAVPPSRWFVWDKGTGDNDFADCELAWTNRDGVVKRFARSWVGANAKERGEADRVHPTQKPVALVEWCIGFFPDTGTILEGRQAIGIEIDERYLRKSRLRASVKRCSTSET